MKNWIVRGLVWSLVLVAAFAFSLATRSGAESVVAVPTWVPIAAVALLFLGGTVLRRSLVEQPEA